MQVLLKTAWVNQLYKVEDSQTVIYLNIRSSEYSASVLSNAATGSSGFI